MNRRRYLKLAIGSLPLVAGCAGRPDSASQATATPRPTEPSTTTTASIDTRATLHVSASAGQSNGNGTKDSPFASIQQAIDQARPGDTVHVDPGEYREHLSFPRAGNTGKPITVTGPPDAILRPRTDYYLVKIERSHIHLTGLTLTGLMDPTRADDPEAYNDGGVVFCRPRTDTDEYLTNIVLKPHRIGNTASALINVMRTRNAEIGEFEVIGPAGARYLYSDRPGHNGEIVYLGTAAGNLGEDWHPWQEVDRTRNVHVHHIDNSAGHPHAELVDVKAGCSNVTIEYCTDAGGAAQYLLEDHDETSETAIHLGGRACVLRWNVIENSQGQAVEIGSWGPAHPDRYEEREGDPLPDALKESGRENSVYGNRLLDYGGLAVQYPMIYPDDGPNHIAEGYGPDDQRHICGNDIDGPTHGSPTEQCPAELPTADQIGHLGGAR